MKKDEKNRFWSRREFMKATTLASTGLAFGGLGNAWPKLSWAGDSPDTLTVITATGPDTLDPHTSISGSYTIECHIFETLVNRDLQPMLAESWENPDKLTWIFHLRKGINFSDGEPFNAQAVKSNLDRYVEPATKAPYRSQFNSVESFEVLDDYTIKIKTKEAYATFIYVIRDIYMISPKAITKYGKELGKNPVGTGPYVLKKWVTMEQAIIEVNPGYHGPKPLISRIIWKPVSEASTRVVELKSGNADIIEKVPQELIPAISVKGLQVIKSRSLYRHGIQINCAVEPFNKTKVRQAFNYAVNKDEIIKYILRGAAYPMTDTAVGLAGPPHPDIKPFPYDPQKAKQLLSEAGYPDGIKCEIITPAGRYPKDKEVTEAISYQVKKSGIDMKVIPMEWGMFIKSYKDSMGYFIGAHSLDAHQQFALDGDSRKKMFSWMGWHHDKFIELLDKATETFDTQERNKIYSEMAKIEFYDAPYVWLYFGQDVYGIRDRVKNFKPRVDSYYDLVKTSIE